MAMPASFNAELVDGDHMDPLKGWVAALQHKIKKADGQVHLFCAVPASKVFDKMFRSSLTSDMSPRQRIGTSIQK